MPLYRSAALAAALLLAASGAAAQATPPRNGPEFQVNQDYLDQQLYPRAAVDSGGHYVVAWVGRDGDLDGIIARRYRSSGVPLGPEFPVNQTTADVQYAPVVGADANGNFVVVWESFNGLNGFDVFGRRFSPDGTPLGPEFQVNTYTTGFQYFADVAVNDDGSFVVAWQSDYQDYYAVMARRFDSAGAAGPEFIVSNYTTALPQEPRVRAGGDGAFVVAWYEYGAGGAAADYDISARRYNAAGNPLANQFVVNNVAADNQSFPSLAVRRNNEFVVSWQSYSPSGGYDIFARRFDASGNAVLGQFLVNSHTTGSQSRSSTALDADGNFLVTWNGAAGMDGSYLSVQGRHFAANANPTSAEFRVNTYTTGDQWVSNVTAKGPGDFLVVWESSDDQDGDLSGIFGQRYGDLIFSDNFEWSTGP
jgi:hypothetical protein